MKGVSVFDQHVRHLASLEYDLVFFLYVSMYDQGRNDPDSRVEVATCCITFVFVALFFIVCFLRVRNGDWLAQIRPSRCVESLGEGEGKGKESKSYPGGCQSREWRGVR
jgi:hypothetical protein